MAMFQEKMHQLTGWVRTMPQYLKGRPLARIVLDGHFTPASGARMARMFPLHAQLSLAYRKPGVMGVEGILDIESNLGETPVSGELHLSPWGGEPFMRLQFTTPDGGSGELVVEHLGTDFFTTQRLEGRTTGALLGDLSLRLPTEQFMRVLCLR
ncbi:MAG: hypothetical protein CVU59_11550 [Deltaproteobacteria bacterium HGW-Deltaproteobacteria-17]|nr:MAG: hypothetical protein CVU59_11550 [Deltaproteobacteria bacterium HGW-Deltaproteobacteria-17]